MALDRLRQILNQVDDDAAIDLQNIEDKDFGTVQRVMMANDDHEFPAEALMIQMISEFRRQGVKLLRSTWIQILKLHDDHKRKNEYNLKDAAGVKSRVGLQVLYLHSRLCANELYESTAGIPIDEGNMLQMAERNRKVQERVELVLADMEDETFAVTDARVTDVELDFQMRLWLGSDAAVEVITGVINSAIDPIDLFKTTPEQTKCAIRNMNVYVCQSLGFLKGCVLVDGILVCTKQLLDNRSDDFFYADVFTLGLHEAAHYCVRVNFNEYQFGSPVSYIVKEGVQHRHDPSIPNKSLEIGRAAEMLIFGGHPEGIQPDWRRSKQTAARDFVEKVRRGVRLPWYEGKEACLKIGMIPREKVSLSFGGEMVNFMAEAL